MTKLNCLRCKTVALEDADRYPEIRFFRCPSCGRRYALEPGKPLVLRWGEPVTLALQPILFYSAPVDRAEEIAKRFVAQYSGEQLKWILQEIRLELEHPTQQVRDTLECKASEEELREYLTLFCESVARLKPQR